MHTVITATINATPPTTLPTMIAINLPLLLPLDGLIVDISKTCRPVLASNIGAAVLAIVTRADNGSTDPLLEELVG